MFLDLGFGFAFLVWAFMLQGYCFSFGWFFACWWWLSGGVFDLDSGVDDALRELWSLFRSSHVRRPRSGGQCWRTGWRVAVRAWRRRGLAGQAAPASPFTEGRCSCEPRLPGVRLLVFPAAFPKPMPRGSPTARQTYAHFHLHLALYSSLYGG